MKIIRRNNGLLRLEYLMNHLKQNKTHLPEINASYQLWVSNKYSPRKLKSISYLPDFPYTYDLTLKYCLIKYELI